jgi:glycerophosphoryl diester phosphodiesterase
MVIHDETVDRTTNGHGAVAEMTAAELQRLDAGSWKDRRFAGQHIPTLGEVSELALGRAQLFVELRGTSPELPARVVQVLREKGIADQAWLFAAERPVLEELRRLAPEMHVRWREGMESGDFVLTWPERLTEATIGVFRERGLRVFTTIRDRVGNNEARLIASRMLELGIDGIICNRVWLLREVFGLPEGPRE